MPFFFLPPEYRAELVLPSAHLSPRTFCGPVHRSRSGTLPARLLQLSLPGHQVLRSDCGPWASPRHPASAP